MNKHISIIGGGWSGLAAAVELCRNNIPVTVYESAKQLGGRARSVQLNNIKVDNGQHLMIGAYQQLLDLLKIIEVDEKTVFHRLSQQLEMLDITTHKTVFSLKLPSLPAPWHLVFGLMRSPSLSFKEKLQTLFRFDRLLKKPINKDLSVDQWLATSGLPDNYIHYLLKPLCLAALTTHSHQASAKTLQTVLQQTFNGPAKNTDLLIPKTDLGQVFPEQAKRFIEQRGGKVLTEQRVDKIHFNNNKASAIQINGQDIDIDQLIVATPAHITQKLFTDLESLSPLNNKIKQLEYEPVSTVYLQYPEHIKLPMAMMGVINASSEWLFDRQFCQQAGLIAVVISANGPHMKLDNEQLAEHIKDEIKSLFPAWPAAISINVIREKRACFRCSLNIDQLRPGIDTAIDNLKLCGDYVYTEKNNRAGLPSTLEACVQSGVKCAQKFIQDYV